MLNGQVAATSLRHFYTVKEGGEVGFMSGWGNVVLLIVGSYLYLLDPLVLPFGGYGVRQQKESVQALVLVAQDEVLPPPLDGGTQAAGVAPQVHLAGQSHLAAVYHIGHLHPDLHLTTTV